MRVLNENKQKLKYSIPTSSEEKYKYDSDGNKIVDYVDEETGTTYYVTTGEYETIYSEPVVFYGNIAGELKDSMAKEFGIGNNPNYATLVTAKGAYNLPFGTLIWRKTEPAYKDFNGQEIIDSASADYDVVGTIDEFLHEDEFLLHKQQK